MRGTTGKIHFTLDIAGDRELSRSMHGYLGRVTNLKPWFERIKADWSATMKLKFQAEGAHEGDAWQPLSEKYARWKARHFAGKGILERTGTLRGQAEKPATEITESSLRMSITAPYAIYHQSSEPRESNLPRRPFASLTGRQKSRWMRMLREHLMRED